MKKIITHNGGFHTDDVFAVATLMLLLGHDVEVIRTRDEEIVENGDYIVDVGMLYNPAKNRFDHHQKEGAGSRANGIPYASFGLVWKEVGEKLCGSKEVAEEIDKKMVQGIDASDNGVDINKILITDVKLYSIWQVVGMFEPTWKEIREVNIDEKFLKSVELAKAILKREIKKTKDHLEAEKNIKKVYDKTKDKKLIILNKENAYGRGLISNFLAQFSEPLYIVFPKENFYQSDKITWQVVALNKTKDTFDLRKSLPESWLGKSKQSLVEVTGVADADFCHRAGFMCLAKTREGAIALAKKALEV